MSSTTIPSLSFYSSSTISSSCCPISLLLRFSLISRLASVMVFLVRYLRPVDVKVKAPDAVFIPFASNDYCMCDVFCCFICDVCYRLFV